MMRATKGGREEASAASERGRRGIGFGRRHAVGVAIVLVAWLLWLAWRQIQAAAFPGSTWLWTTPEAAGFNAAALEAFSERIGGSGCIVQRGRMVYAWGDPAGLQDVASAAKPFYTHFTLRAVEEGLIGSLDDPVVGWVPELSELNSDLGFKDRGITFRHLLEQTSGYALRDPPGTAFAYNDAATGLLVWTLVRRVYASGYGGVNEALIAERLGHRLHFEDHPTMRHPSSRPGRLRISPRDMARFGHLYLMRGRWRRHRVLRKDLLRLALDSPAPADLPRTDGEEAAHVHKVHSIGGGTDQKGHAACFSYFWWLNRMAPDGRRLLPDAPPRTFMATGHGGRFAMVIIPEEKLVAVWFDAFKNEELSPFDEIGRWEVNGAVRELMQARIRR